MAMGLFGYAGFTKIAASPLPEVEGAAALASSWMDARRRYQTCAQTVRTFWKPA